jgi:hypothetical protein
MYMSLHIKLITPARISYLRAAAAAKFDQNVFDVSSRVLYEKRSNAAFPKLWSADHRWSSGSALVVLLD